MSDKEIIEKLAKIAFNQQKIITKLAQELQALPDPNHPNLREAETILNNLPGPTRSAVAALEVHPTFNPDFDGEIRVKFVPGKASDMTFKTVQDTVKKLTLSNALRGAAYLVKEVA